MLSPSHLTLINYLFILLKSFCQENDGVGKQNAALQTCKGTGTEMCDSHSNVVRQERKTITWDRTGKRHFPVTMTPPLWPWSNHLLLVSVSTPLLACALTQWELIIYSCDVWHVLILGTAVNEEKMRLALYFTVLKVHV